MTKFTDLQTLDPDLTGLRVGLSGAIPEPEEWGGRALDWDILNAVTTLADTVFSSGGHLIHGSHPSFTPRILAQAEPYAKERGEPVVTLVLSGLFGDTWLARQIAAPRYRGVLNLILVDAVAPPGHEGHGVEDPTVRNASLAAMRERLIDEMDVLVLMGGKRWTGTENKPGTLEELEIAQAHGIPTFPLGGLGGMVAQLAASRESRTTVNARGLDGSDSVLPISLYSLGTRTGSSSLGAEEESIILTTPDYGRAIGLIARHLHRMTPRREQPEAFR